VQSIPFFPNLFDQIELNLDEGFCGAQVASFNVLVGTFKGRLASSPLAFPLKAPVAV
jgi:hypothetical protein